VAAREAANRINRGNSPTDQDRAAAAVAVNRSSRLARINPDRNLRIDRAADNSLSS
jgi:hypothetical protein